MLKRESRLHKAQRVWELFLNNNTAEQITHMLNIPMSEVLSILNYTAPEFYDIDLSHTLLVKIDKQQIEIEELQKSLDKSRNQGWIPISIAVVISSIAIIISLVIISV